MKTTYHDTDADLCFVPGAMCVRERVACARLSAYAQPACCRLLSAIYSFARDRDVNTLPEYKNGHVFSTAAFKKHGALFTTSMAGRLLWLDVLRQQQKEGTYIDQLHLHGGLQSSL